MLWVGLTGSLGTGKSTVSSILRQMGYAVVDADSIAHQALGRGEKAYDRVVQYFGPEILNSDQSIDRKKLAQKVFSDSENLKLLESIVHPEVKARVNFEKQRFIQAHLKLAFYDVPLLFEKKMQSDFDKVVVVSCTPELQYKRLRERNQWSEQEISSRLQAQLPLAEKELTAHFVICNNDSLETLQKEVRKMVQFLKTLV